MRKTAFMAVLTVVVFALMLFLNLYAPYVSDDYAYHFIITEDGSYGERIESFADVVLSMKNHYYTVNGRIVLHGILQYVLMFGETVFDVLNSVMFVLLALLIYKHCKGTSKKNSPLMFLVINIMLWLFLPSYGMTVLWASGSVNYLWSSVIRLAALLPFRLWADKQHFRIPSVVMPFIMLPLSLLAGATNENSAAAFIGMSVLFIILYRIRKIKIPVWSFVSLAGSLAGFAFIILAPANSTRSEAFTGVKASVLFRIFSIPVHYAIYLMAPICVFVIFYMIQRRLNKANEKGNTIVALIYLLGSVGGAGVMLASPYFPTRAWTSMAICIIIAAGMMLYNAELSFSRNMRGVAAIIAAICCVWCAGEYIQLGVDSIEITQKINAREAYIEEQKATGNYDIFISKIASDIPRSCYYNMSDISEKTDNWTNVTKALYYGVNSITAE